MKKELQIKIEKIKNAGEDYNFYPTTKEMIRIVFDDAQNANLYKNQKLLDIGAGDGNLFSVWDQLIDEKFPRDEHGYRPNMMEVAQQYYAMEKSHTLLEYLPKNVVTVGTDFHHQTLIDKQMDIIFCNPPYSEFESWATKAILEANSTLLYLIIPDRWKNSGKIKHAIERREASCVVIHSDNFLNAPRAARANIDIIKIDFRGIYKPLVVVDEEKLDKRYHEREYYRQESWSRNPKTDPFEIWFEDSFQKFEKVKTETDEKPGKSFKENVALTPGANLIKRMENLYIFETEKIQGTYEALCGIDPLLLKEFDVSLENVKKALKEKLSGLKHKYWKELFDNLNKITDRLTSKSRDSLLKTLQENLEVDFSANNAYMVVLWAIKNANTYYDQQLITAYEEMVNRESVLRYKSNRHFSDDDWRFAKNNSHYYLNDKLDYRIVCNSTSGIDTGSWSYDAINGLSRSAYNYIQDLCTIAKNLGYEVLDGPLETQWSSGKEIIFYERLPGEYKVGEKTKIGKVQEVFETQYKINDVIYHKSSIRKTQKFMTVRAYKNGNLHFKFNQEFLRKWNVEFGRLKGWINNKQSASEEMNIPMEEMNKLFKCNFQIEKASDVILLEKVV